jgi:PAS domain S-box-containing protein
MQDDDKTREQLIIELNELRKRVAELEKGQAESKPAEDALSEHYRNFQQTTQQLEQSRNMLQMIIESIPVRVFWKDANLRYMGCNSLFARDGGYSHPDELLGKDDFAMGWREQADLYRMDDRQVMESRRPKIGIVEPQTTPEGDNIWLKTSKVPLQMPNGEVFGILGIYEDITERKRVEEELIGIYRQNQLILKAAGEGIVGLDEKGTITFANPETLELLGYAEDELIGKDLHLTIHHSFPDGTHYPETECPMSLSLRDGKNKRVRDEFLWKKDGTSFPSAYSSTPIIENGQVVGAVVTFRDISVRKRFEDDLKRANGYLENVFANSPDAIGIVGESGRFTMWNRMAEVLYGYTFEEMRRMNAFDLYADKEELAKMLMRLRQEGSVKKWEMLMKKGDGSIVPFEISIGVLQDSENRNLGSVAVARDLSGLKETLAALRASNDQLNQEISERKSAEEALRKSESRHRDFVNLLPQPILELDKNLNVTFANEATIRVTGYDQEDIEKGINALQFLLPEDRDRANQDTLRFRNGEGNEYAEYEVLRKDGTQLPVGVYYGVIENTDNPGGLRLIAVDITERKRIEETLKQSEERFRKLFETGSDAIVIFDGETRKFIDVNERALRLYGYSRDEFLKLKHSDITAEPDRADGLLKEIMLGTRNQVPLSYHRKKDGTEFPVEISTSTFMVADRKVLCGIVKDITERIQAEAQRSHLEAENRQLQKVESLGRMAGAIAHIFNNQLAVVMGNLEMALMDLSGDAEVREYLVESMQAARRSADVSGLMLTYLGQNAGESHPLDLSEVCRQNLPILKDAMPEGITLETGLLSPGPVVRAHVNGIKQVLTHLITNGWESIGKNAGTVTLATRIMQRSEIPKSYLQPVGWQPTTDAFSCVEVMDTGCGMEEDDFDKIFDPFFTTKFTGRGLGLAVVLGIVKIWGGAIMVESKMNHGSIFRVLLPLVSDQLPHMSANTIDTHVMEPGGTVLLVDDQDAVRTMGKTMLNRLGYEVLAASGGAEAVNLFREHSDQVRLVITDLTMPGMDGWETLEALRKIRPHIRVVLASGYDEAHVKTGNYSRQPHVFLHKPYSKGDLQKAIEKALKSK